MAASDRDRALRASPGPIQTGVTGPDIPYKTGGQLKFALPVSYFFSIDYKGLDRPPDAAGWGSTDVKLAVPVTVIGTLAVGKLKETFSYEIVVNATNLPQIERILNPFFTSRNVGIRLNHTLFDKKMTYSGGWFNDWWVNGRPYEGSSNHYTADLLLLPFIEGLRPYRWGTAAESEKKAMRDAEARTEPTETMGLDDLCTFDQGESRVWRRARTLVAERIAPCRSQG